MNFGDMQEAVFRYLGFHESGQRKDHRRQQVKDDLNHALKRLRMHAPYWLNDVEVTTLAVTGGTGTYTLDDLVDKPLKFWTENTTAHEIPYIPPTLGDADGSKASSASAGSGDTFNWTWYPPTTSAEAEGTNASINNASTAFSKSGGDSITSSHVGRRIRINGEESIYTISAQADADNATLDRDYIGKLTGVGTTGTPDNLSGVKWEIGPAGTYRIQLLPTPSASTTLYYRYVKRFEPMLKSDDVASLPEDWHDAIISGALMFNDLYTENSAGYSRHRADWDDAVSRMKAEDREEAGTGFKVPYASMLNSTAVNRFLQPGNDPGRRFFG